MVSSVSEESDTRRIVKSDIIEFLIQYKANTKNRLLLQ